MDAANARRQAAEEGKDVTPVATDNKVTRVVWGDKGPKEEDFDIVDQTPKPPVKVESK